MSAPTRHSVQSHHKADLSALQLGLLTRIFYYMRSTTWPPSVTIEVIAITWRTLTEEELIAGSKPVYPALSPEQETLQPSFNP
jgi:hypothetical protein